VLQASEVQASEVQGCKVLQACKGEVLQARANLLLSCPSM
jgi:hypothetical protein